MDAVANLTIPRRRAVAHTKSRNILPMKRLTAIPMIDAAIPIRDACFSLKGRRSIVIASVFVLWLEYRGVVLSRSQYRLKKIIRLYKDLFKPGDIIVFVIVSIKERTLYRYERYYRADV